MSGTTVTTPTASNVLPITLMSLIFSAVLSLALHPMLISMSALNAAFWIGTVLLLYFTVEYANSGQREQFNHYRVSVFTAPIGMAFIGASCLTIPDIHIPATITAALLAFWLLFSGKAQAGKDRGFDVITVISLIGLTANSAYISSMLADPSSQGQSVFFGELLQAYLILHGLSYVRSSVSHLRAGTATRGSYAHSIGFLVNIGLVFSAVQMLRMI